MTNAMLAVIPTTPADLRDQHWLDEQIEAIDSGIEAVLDIARNWTGIRNLSRLHPGVSAQEYVLAHVQHPLGAGVVVPLLESSNWSNRQIAAVAGVSPQTVTNRAGELSKVGQLPDRPAETLGADGKLRPSRVIREVTAQVIEPEQPETEVMTPLWDQITYIIEIIEKLEPDSEAIAAAVPTKRQVSTARKLRKVGMVLGGIALKLERLTQPTPEEEQARREAEEAARPEKARRELEAAKLELDRLVTEGNWSHTKELADARERFERAEDQVLRFARMAEDKAIREARRALVTP